MKIVSRSVSENFIGQPHHYIESNWVIAMDQQDLPDTEMHQRFNQVQVQQRKAIKPDVISHMTWFKGTCTNTFVSSTKDKQKKKIIEMVESFILDNNDPLIYVYTDEHQSF